MAERQKRRWNKTLILAALRSHYEETGLIPTVKSWRGAAEAGRLRPDVKTVRRHFGSWSAGLKEAGFGEINQGTYSNSNKRQERGPYRKTVKGSGYTPAEKLLRALEKEKNGTL